MMANKMTQKITRKEFLRKSFQKGLYAISLVPALALVKEIVAKNVHSRLNDAVLLEQFQQLSNQLACVCGKSMPISQINDFGHCNTWPMRSVIDGLLEDKTYGQDLSPLQKQKLILEGFVGGFGEMAQTHQAFEKARSEQYKYLMSGFVSGFGESILSQPRSKNPIVLASVFASVIIGGFFYFLKSRHKKLQASNQDNAAPATALSEEEKNLLQKLN